MRFTFQAAAGVTYYIALDGYDGAFGTAVLNINPPLNDNFSNCQQLGDLGTDQNFQIRIGGILHSPAGSDKSRGFRISIPTLRFVRPGPQQSFSP